MQPSYHAPVFAPPLASLTLRPPTTARTNAGPTLQPIVLLARWLFCEWEDSRRHGWGGHSRCACPRRSLMFYSRQSYGRGAAPASTPSAPRSPLSQGQAIRNRAISDSDSTRSRRRSRNPTIGCCWGGNVVFLQQQYDLFDTLSIGRQGTDHHNG